MKVTKPKVKVLAEGKDYTVKQMSASTGDLLPKHHADAESILLVQEGVCILNMDGEDHVMNQGDAFIIPPQVKHQIRAETDFKAAHFMPAGIKFEYFT